MARLIPTDVIKDRVNALLAADATTLAPAALAVHVHLIIVNVNPQTYTFNAADEATFTGGAAKSAGTGAQQFFSDNDGNRYVQLLEPAGGWTWTCTVTPAAPETVYALCVTDNADAVTYGTLLLTAGPQEISLAGQGFSEGSIQLILGPGFFDALPVA